MATLLITVSGVNAAFEEYATSDTITWTDGVTKQ